MAKLDLNTLQTTIQGWLDETKQANPSFTPTTDNIYGLQDKIGDMVTIEGDFQDKLPELDGDELPFGATIEEYFVDLVLPQVAPTNVSGNEYGIVYQPLTAEDCLYSTTFGEKVIYVSEPLNNLKKAALNSATAAQMLAKTTLRLTNSKSLYKYGLKKQMLGNTINKAVDASLVTTIAKPTDTNTSEAFIKEIKNRVEDAQFANEGNNIKNCLIGASPALTLYIKKGIMSAVEVDALAGAFNKEDLAMPCNIKIVDDFGVIDDNDVYALLVDPRGVKLRSHYQYTDFDKNGTRGYGTFSDHSEYTGFISGYVYMRAFKE